MNGFGIYVKNTLLEKKHHDSMGKAVWLYMWFLDKITSISEDGKGKVLGGKPIKSEDFAADLQLSKRTYFRYLTTLRDAGYINTIQTPYGLSIEVTKATKPTVDKSKRELPDVATLYTKSGNSLTKSGNSNKTIQYDNTVDIKKLNKESSENFNVVVDKVSNRGVYSPSKEKIKEKLNNGGIKSLNLSGG